MLVDKDFHRRQPRTAAALNAALFASARPERNYYRLLLRAGNPYERIILSVSENYLSFMRIRYDERNL